MENMVMEPKFWKGKKVLITGHNGFKGSWLSLWLQSLDAEVFGYSLSPPTNPSLFEVAQVVEGMTSIAGNVCDLEHLKSVVVKHAPEIVIHLAAQSLVRYSYAHPVETYTTNVLGTVNVLEAVRHANCVKALVVVTSDKCYENKEWIWGYRENDPMGGFDPYSSSKGCAELVTVAYRNAYFNNLTPEHKVAVATARAGNVIGGGDWGKDRLVPDIVNAFIENQPIFIRHPNAVRPWQHVLEPLNGYLTLAERLWQEGTQFAEGWNFGPHEDEAKPVSWILEQLESLLDRKAVWKLDSLSQLHEANHLKLDCSKAKKQLGCYPKLRLFRALEWVAAWYQGYQNNEDMKRLTLSQIHHYQNMDKEI